MDPEQERQRIREEYSKEFVDNLIAKERQQQQQQSMPPIAKAVVKPAQSLWSKIVNNKIVMTMIGAFVVLFLIAIVSIVANQGSTSKMSSFTQLYADNDQLTKISDRYRDLIDNTQIRAHNVTLNAAAIALQFDLEQIKKTYPASQQKSIDKQNNLSDPFKQAMIRLDQAELNEILDRTYLQEAIVLIEQLQIDINRFSQKSSSKEMKRKLRIHYESFENVKKAIKTTILED